MNVRKGERQDKENIGFEAFIATECSEDFSSDQPPTCPLGTGEQVSIDEGHRISFKCPTALARVAGYVDCVVQKVTETQIYPEFNRDAGLSLSGSWNPSTDIFRRSWVSKQQKKGGSTTDSSPVMSRLCSVDCVMTTACWFSHGQGHRTPRASHGYKCIGQSRHSSHPP